MMEKQIQHIKNNSNIPNLLLIASKKENIIKSLARLTLENNWCYQNGCTTCGALTLKANIGFFAIQKCKKDLDLNFIFEDNLRWLILFRMPIPIRYELVQVLSKELNELKNDEIEKLNQEFLRFIILEIWRALDKNTSELLNISRKLIYNFIKDMENHHNKITS